MLLSRMRHALPVIVLVLLAASARADSGWLLTTVDFRQQPVVLHAIDAAGVRFAAATGQQAQFLSFDQFLQLDRASAPLPAQGKFTLLGVTGDRLIGQPTGYQDEQIVWRSAAADNIRVPLKNVVALVRSGKTLEDLDRPRTEDVVALSNGDSVKGLVTHFTDSAVKIRSDDNDVELALDSIDSIHFAPAGKPPASPPRAFRLRLGDGSILTAATVQADNDSVSFALADGVARRLPLSSVVSIEQLNGPVSYLSSRQPAAVIQTPFFGGDPWPTRMDQTVGGKPIQFGTRTFGRGIGVHAYSRLDYPLDGSYAVFRTQYAIATDTKAQFADVTVRIKLDGKIVHERTDFRSGELAPVVTIDIPPACKLLTLEVDYGQANDTQDRFNWIEPALLRNRPTTRPTPH